MLLQTRKNVLRWVVCTTLVTILSIGTTEVMGQSAGATPSSPSAVIHLQVWKQATDSGLRIHFDKQIVYEDKPTATAPNLASDSSPAPTEVGRFVVEASTEHTLWVEAKEAGCRSRLVWKPEPADQWIVVAYYSRSNPPRELPTITFSIQDYPAVVQ